MKGCKTGALWLALASNIVADAQWDGVDEFMQEQIGTGWWSANERELVLRHLDVHGAPEVNEEVWSIEGLSYSSALQLMQSNEWRELVDFTKRPASNRSGGLRAEIRSGWRQMMNHSVRIRNGIKWGVRYESKDLNGQPDEWSGYATFSSKSEGWDFLIGGHRLGWGNRLNVEEESFFAGLDDPVFALPVTYAYAPAWGRSDWVPRKGLAIARKLARCESVLSLSEFGRDGAFLVHNASSGWGCVTRWKQDSGLGIGGFWNWRHGWTQGIVEAARGSDDWAITASWQATPSRYMERHVRLALRGNREAKLTNVEAILGGQWSNALGLWRVRWRCEWQPFAQHSPLLFQVRRVLGRNAFWEVRWKSNQTSFQTSKSPLRRLEIRHQTTKGNLRSDMRVAPFARMDALGGWSYSMKYEAGQVLIGLGLAAWDMPPLGIAYFADPAISGVRYRPMSGSGNRVTASVRFRPAANVKFQLVATKSSEPNAEVHESDMLTLVYAQTGVHVSLQLRL